MSEQPNDKMDELVADAMAFRSLAAMPSLWSLTLMFGPYFQMNIAWGTGRGIEVRQYELPASPTLALRLVIHKAQAEIQRLSAENTMPVLGDT